MNAVQLPKPKAKSHSASTGLVLTNEAGLRCENPPWQLVDQVVRELDPGRGNSFCCLSAPGNSYVQTLCGFNDYHLEWRVISATAPDGYIHYRAGYPGGSSKPFELKKHDFVSPGEHRDLIQLDDVVEAFRAFHRGAEPPALFDWRPLDI